MGGTKNIASALKSSASRRERKKLYKAQKTFHRSKFKTNNVEKCKAEFIFAVKHFYDNSNLTEKDFGRAKRFFVNMKVGKVEFTSTVKPI